MATAVANSPQSSLHMRLLTLLLLCHHSSVGLTSTVDLDKCGVYRGASAADLKINHAQVLGSHNSYHVGNSIWNYTHPPLDVQLDLGLRAFELDIYYDFRTAEIRVLHVVGADEGSNCRTLQGCLASAKAWSDAHPWHFPFFFQLEFLGGIKPTGESRCTHSDVEDSISCASTKCAGLSVTQLYNCLFLQCSTELLAARNGNSACQTLLPCLTSEVGKLHPSTVLTPSLTNSTVYACSAAADDTSPNKVTIASDEVAAVAQKLTSILDATFPSTHRITPSDLFVGGFTEVAAMSGYTPSNAGNFWPTVDASRGKALFWLVNAASLAPSLTHATRPFFFDGVDMSVRKADAPSGAEAMVRTGALVRTRADIPGEVLSASRRATALDSGATVVSTDLFPTADLAPGGFSNWTLLNPSTHVWIPSGSPVRCNPVSAAGMPSCTSQLLEDPGAVSFSVACPQNTTKKTQTTTPTPMIGLTIDPTTTRLSTSLRKAKVCMMKNTINADDGYEDSYRGWYDVQGCGRCYDYCRWVGNLGSGGDPRTKTRHEDSWWSCRLGGGSYTNDTYPSWSYWKCSGEGGVPQVIPSFSSHDTCGLVVLMLAVLLQRPSVA